MNPLEFFNWQRIVAYAVVIVSIATVLVGYGYHLGVRQLWEYQAKEATETVRVARARTVVDTQVVVKYVKVAAEAKVVTNTIREEVIRYVESNAGACLDPVWGRLHDAAAEGRIPDPQSVVDGTGGTPTAAAAIETVTENYAACRRNAGRLTALQEWVIRQSAVK